MKAEGRVFKYGDNVDTDVIIPARYLNSSDPAELATHCMEDIDKDFVKKVQKGDIIVANKNFGCGSSSRCKLCYCRNLCKNFLPQFHQYRSSDYRMSGSCKGN